MAKSVMDYIFRWLALKFVPKEERRNVGLIGDQPTEDAPAAPSETSAMRLIEQAGIRPAELPPIGQSAPSGAPTTLSSGTATLTAVEKEMEIVRMQTDAPPCPDCGALTVRSGACYKCMQCGSSLGCS